MKPGYHTRTNEFSDSSHRHRQENHFPGCLFASLAVSGSLKAEGNPESGFFIGDGLALIGVPLK